MTNEHEFCRIATLQVSDVSVLVLAFGWESQKISKEVCDVSENIHDFNDKS